VISDKRILTPLACNAESRLEISKYHAIILPTNKSPCRASVVRLFTTFLGDEESYYVNDYANYSLNCPSAILADFIVADIAFNTALTKLIGFAFTHLVFPARASASPTWTSS